jgi:hypothetical protein
VHNALSCFDWDRNANPRMYRLAKRDFDMNFHKSIKIEIPAQYTKTKAAHTRFVSREASSSTHSIGPNDLVFTTNQNPYHASMAEIEAFSRYWDSAGLLFLNLDIEPHHTLPVLIF